MNGIESAISANDIKGQILRWGVPYQQDNERQRGSNHEVHPPTKDDDRVQRQWYQLPYELQAHLKRRVSDILAQIKCVSSASHFDRHLVEVSELLDCDAPTGFTPTMILEGVPEIINLLSDAVLKRKVEDRCEENIKTMRAFTPLCQRVSPVRTSNPFFRRDDSSSSNQMCVGRKERRSSNTVNNGPGALDKCNTETDSVLAFLPPLVHRAEQAGVQPVPHTVDAPGTRGSCKSVARPNRQRDVVAPVTNNTASWKAPDQMSFPVYSQCTTSTRLGTLLEADPCPPHAEWLKKKQPQPESVERGSNAYCDDNANYTSPLRDIPSALEAMMYHCSLPLLCLTPEDYENCASATHILVSTLSTMVQNTWDDSSNPKLPQSLQCDGVGNEVSEGNRNCVIGVCGEGEQCSPVTVDAKQACELKHRNAIYQLRRAALRSLHALLSLVEARSNNLIGKHFSTRDRELYELFGPKDLLGSTIATIRSSLSENCKESEDAQDHVSIFIIDDEKSSRRSLPRGRRVSQYCLKAMQKTQEKKLVRRVAPISVYNNVVDVNVLIPLLERWTYILECKLSRNEVLDSAQSLLKRQYWRHKDKKRGEMAILEPTAVGSSYLKLKVTLDATEKEYCKRWSVEKVGVGEGEEDLVLMYERDVEEIYLLLRICLQLSPYKHHVNFSSWPDGKNETADGRRRPFRSAAVLVCLTMSRCMEGDICLPLCVECLWNLLDVIPEEAALQILHHTVVEGGRFQQSAGMCANDANVLSLSSLSASESLIHTFLQLLTNGHRLDYRELRNDVIALVSMVIRSHSRKLKEQEERMLKDPGAEPPALLPITSIQALTLMAKMVFDLLCGPELQSFGITADMVRDSLETLVRHHTVISPTTRRENLQFKILGWRFLEAFHEWQNVRLSVEQLSQARSASSPLSPSDDMLKNCFAGNNSICFDVCSAGFVDVLLMYVDTECNNKFVLEWSREDLFALQEEAWGAILILIEPNPRNVDTVCSEGETAPCSWREATGDKVLGVTCSDISGALKSVGTGGLTLLRADKAFVTANGIDCAMRYIRETAAGNLKSMCFLAVHTLCVLSRFSAHRNALIETRTQIPGLVEYAPSLLVTIVQVIERILQENVSNENRTNSTSATLGATKEGSGFRANVVCSAEKCELTVKSNIEKPVKRLKDSMKNKQQVGKSPLGKEQQVHELTGQLEVLNGSTLCTQNYTALRHQKTPVYFPSQAVEVLLKCLSLLHNIVNGGREEVAATQRAFVLMNGVKHTLNLIWNSLTPRPPYSEFGRFLLEERNKNLVCAALNCLRVFLIENAVGQAQFVDEDGVDTLLAVVEASLGNETEQALTKTAEKDYPLLRLVLTMLADVLRESEGARDAFLKWFSYTPGTVERADDGRTNAVQLLLRLWDGELVGSDTNKPAQKCSAFGCSVTSHRRPTQRGSGVSTLEVKCEGASTFCNEVESASEACEGAKIPGKKTSSNGDIPVLNPSNWGLQSLGLQGRDLVVAVLWSRFADLERKEDLLSNANSSTRCTTLRQMQEQLSAPICKVLGLRVCVYACLAALGFERLSNVKATPQERVKLLYIAALETICKDEIWGAIAESVDLLGRATVITEGGHDTVSNSLCTEGRHRGLSTFRTFDQLVPIIPDAEQLVDVLLDVDARSKELKRLADASLDMQEVHDAEEMHRSLLTLMRCGHLGNTPAISRQYERNPHGDLSETNSMVVSLIPPPGDFASGENETTSYKSYTSTSGQKVSTETFGSWNPRSRASLGVLEKKRRKELMIKRSFQCSKAQEEE